MRRSSRQNAIFEWGKVVEGRHEMERKIRHTGFVDFEGFAEDSDEGSP